jgi:hypothetical protein
MKATGTIFHTVRSLYIITAGEIVVDSRARKVPERAILPKPYPQKTPAGSDLIYFGMPMGTTYKEVLAARYIANICAVTPRIFPHLFASTHQSSRQD